jgi:hypothetical protein
MTAAVTNPYTITWGTFACGGTTERLIPELHRVSKDHGAFEVEFVVVVRGTSDANFAANCAEMEAEFAKRRQKILFQVGASTIQSFDPSDSVNTGFNSYARISKPGTPGADTDRSRRYVVTLGCALPSTDTSGRKETSVVVEYDPAKRRTVSIEGEWTAIGNKNATAQYAAQIEAYCTSALSALLPSGTFERVREMTTADDQDKSLRFSRTYREVGHISGDTILANSDIVEASVSFTREIDTPGDSGGGNVRRLQTIRCSFSCYLDKTSSVDLDALYKNTVRPYIKARFEAEYSPAQYGIVGERPMYAKYANQLSADLTFQAAIEPTDVVQSTTSQRIVENSGLVMTGEWDGGIFSKHVDQGFATRRRFGSRTGVVLGSIGPQTRVGGEGGGYFGLGGIDSNANPDSGLLRPEGGGGLGGSGWKLLDNDSATTTKHVGQVGDEQMILTTLVEQIVEEYVEQPGDGGGVFGAAASGGGESPGLPIWASGPFGSIGQT